MNLTPNLNLRKPEGHEIADFEDLNANMDIVDGKLGTTGHDHSGTAGNGPKILAGGLANGAATDTVIGTRTITDTVTAAAAADTPTNLFSKIGYMIKSITGKSNWYTLPALTLEAVNTLFGTSGHSHNGTAGQGPKISAGNVTSTATGNIAATNVQEAIAELEAEKAPVAHTHNEINPAGNITDVNTFHNGKTRTGSYAQDVTNNRPPIYAFGAILDIAGRGQNTDGHAQLAISHQSELAVRGAWGAGFGPWKQLAVTNSPALTGTPTAPTAAVGTNTTQLATTEYVQTAVGDKQQTIRYALIVDEKPSGINGGTFAAGAWRTRTLNTIKHNDSIVTLNNNQITLPAGVYKIHASCPAIEVNKHKARLYNITDGVTAITGAEGNSTKTTTEDGVTTRSNIIGVVNINKQTAFEIQHYAEGTSNTGTGFGDAFSASNEPEIYSVIEIWKVG